MKRFWFAIRMPLGAVAGATFYLWALIFHTAAVTVALAIFFPLAIIAALVFWGVFRWRKFAKDASHDPE